jgi:predicted translin family RNA/ssDNA-binding protein
LFFICLQIFLFNLSNTQYCERGLVLSFPWPCAEGLQSKSESVLNSINNLKRFIPKALKTSLKTNYSMINLEKIQTELSDYDSQREDLIKKSRDILKLSKLLIYAVHRDEIEKAKKLKNDIESEIKALDSIVAHDTKLQYEGSYKIAVQEYVEAVLYLEFVQTGKIILMSNLQSEHYILGLADLPGELVRRAVYLASKGDKEGVAKIRDAIDNIYGQFLTLNSRGNELRKKVDGIKYSLNKLQDLVLELKLRG